MALCKGIRIPESTKCLLVESWIQQIFAVESGIPQMIGIWNPTNDCRNLEPHWWLESGIPGAHQMEPPSALISWVSPFPSRFINRTACSPRKVSYFRESRMLPWKKKMKLNEVELSSPSFDRFSFYYTSIFIILQPLGSGYHKIKVNELPDRNWAWSDGTKSELRITERLSLPVFLFVVIHSTCKHALRKGSTIKLSVDDLELFDDQLRKSARIVIWFLSSPWSGFPADFAS